MQSADIEITFASYLQNHLGTFDRYYGEQGGAGGHEHWSVHFIINAHARLLIDEEDWDLSGSWLWAGYPGPRYQQNGGDPKPQGHYRIALRGALLQRWLDDGLWPMRPLAIRDVPALSERFEYFLKQLQGSTPLHQRLRAHALEACFLEAWRQQQPAPERELWLQRCCSYLEDHACDYIDYQRLSAQLQMPLPTLRRRFRKAMGQPLHTYLLAHRTRLAQQLLLESDQSLDGIADELGYDDVAYFSRQFKKIAGMSPSAFRRERYY